MYYVYVLNKEGHPIMPTKRYGKVRRMLRDNKAKAVKTKPFTIQLLYEPDTKTTQPVHIGVDPGRTNIGMAAVREDGNCLYSAVCETRNKEISRLMKERAMHRRMSRRGERLARKRLAKKLGMTTKFLAGRMLPGCDKPVMLKDIINTESRFNNRKRAAGSLTPTARQLLLTHINLIKQICRILPITEVVLELNKFAFMKLANTDVMPEEYSKGTLFGFSSDREYLEEEQDGVCLLCKTKPIKHIHHIVPTSRGGSDTVANKSGLCEDCHEIIHKDAGMEELLLSEKTGLQKEYAALSVLNQILPFLVKEYELLFTGNLHITTGYETKKFRDAHHLMKNHDVDAYAITCSALKSVYTVDIPMDSYRIKQFRRHNRQLIHRQAERTYKLDGTVIAKNRKKRMEQKVDSLAEWYEDSICKLGKAETLKLISRLTVKKSQRSYNKPGRLLPGTVFRHEGKRHVMTGQLTNGAYLISEGVRYPAKKCEVVSKNGGFVYM